MPRVSNSYYYHNIIIIAKQNPSATSLPALPAARQRYMLLKGFKRDKWIISGRVSIQAHNTLLPGNIRAKNPRACGVRSKDITSYHTINRQQAARSSDAYILLPIHDHPSRIKSSQQQQQRRGSSRRL